MAKSLLVLLLAGLAGCYVSNPPAAAPATPVPAAAAPAPAVPEAPRPPISKSKIFTHARIQVTCAPWDGPAIEVLLTPKKVECDRMDFPCLIISVWKQPIAVSNMAFTFPDAGGQVGAMIFCQKEATCEHVKAGSVRFEAFEPGGIIRGEFEVTLPDGRRERGSFESTLCKQGLPCG